MNYREVVILKLFTRGIKISISQFRDITQLLKDTMMQTNLFTQLIFSSNETLISTIQNNFKAAFYQIVSRIFENKI